MDKSRLRQPRPTRLELEDGTAAGVRRSTPQLALLAGYQAEHEAGACHTNLHIAGLLRCDGSSICERLNHVREAGSGWLMPISAVEAQRRRALGSPRPHGWLCDSVSEVLGPNQNQEYEAMRDQQGRHDRRGNEKRGSERSGVNLESLTLKTRKQEVRRTPHVEHPHEC